MMEGARARYMAQRLTAAIIIGPQKASGNPHANGKMGPPGGAPGPGPRVITPACQRAIGSTKTCSAGSGANWTVLF